MFTVNCKGQGSLLVSIIATLTFGMIVSSATTWYLSMNDKVDVFDDKLEAMSIAMSEWQRLEHISLDELEENREKYKTPWNVGDKYKISVTLGEQGVFEEGQCKTPSSDSDDKNCFKNTIMTVYDSNNIPLYTTRTLPLSSGGGSGEAVGTIVPRLSENFTSTSEASKYLYCDGSNYDISKYPKLYKVLGTNTLPDLRDRFLQGNDVAGTYLEGGFPNIKGVIGAFDTWLLYKGGHRNIGGAFYAGPNLGRLDGEGISSGGGDNFIDIYFDASKYNSIFRDDVTTVQPPAVTVRYYIRAK